MIACGGSVVGVGESRLAAFVERTDAFDSVGMDGRAPVRLHHDGYRLLDRLPLAHADRLPEAGALLIAMPVKIKGGTGGPVRLVGVLP